MEFVAYQNIKRLRKNHLCAFRVGDRIVVEEKVDGANFSIRYDNNCDSIKAFSASQELTPKITLRGAYNWSQEQDKENIKNILGEKYIAYGEWLVPHTVEYPKDIQKKPYFFDIYDIENDKWLDIDNAKEMVKELKFEFVPILYDGPFISWEHIYSLLGKTMLGGKADGNSTGEGIIVKNMTRLNNPNDRYPYFVKIVCDRFCEVHKVKKHDTKEIEKRVEIQAEVESIVTKARVEKLVNKMIDNEIIPECWGVNDVATIYKNITRDVFHDCMKEEPEVVQKIGKLFGPIANTVSRGYVDELVKSRGE